MTKTTTYVIVGGGAAILILYLVFSKSSPVKLGGKTATTGGTAGIIDASGRAAAGLSKLWDSVSKTFTGGDDDGESTDPVATGGD
jgi:hypothetical protein